MLRKILRTLDGQATGWRGQSLVEMTITFPILILMILGLVEIGFVANNYMILMDVARNAARDAVNFSPDPTKWDDHDTRNQHRLACNTSSMSGGNGYFQLLSNVPTAQDQRTIPRAADLPGYFEGQLGSTYAFFDEITCQVTKGMSPLTFNDYAQNNSKGYPTNLTAKDDIVISAISFSTVDYTKIINDPYSGVCNTTPSTGRSFAGSYGQTANPGYCNGPALHNDTWVTVTGRWPLANRFCTSATHGGDIRDPFDWKRNDYVQSWHNGPSGASPDLWEDPGPYWKYDSGTGDMVQGTWGLLSGPLDSQAVRGFVFTGRAVGDDGCYGSRFTVQDIETRLNLDKTWNPTSPNGGAVIVELFWQHHPLVLGPLFEGFTGNKVNDPVLYVWSWYPLSSTEPTQTPPTPKP